MPLTHMHHQTGLVIVPHLTPPKKVHYGEGPMLERFDTGLEAYSHCIVLSEQYLMSLWQGLRWLSRYLK